MPSTQTYYSNGKLLLTGEYVVLDGATALAIPTKYGQDLVVETIATNNKLQWTSLDHNDLVWLDTNIEIDSLTSIHSDKVTRTLIEILSTARTLNPQFLTGHQGYRITTHVDFDRSWGLGTSSTLINNIAQWANVDAFQLLAQSFGGSGYDIAAAKHDTPIFYTNTTPPQISPAILKWDFTNQLYFVHLNQKQDSKEGIAHYKKNPPTPLEIETISDFSKKLLLCYNLEDFNKLMTAHETAISKIVKMPTIKERLFTDYKGCIKSLGAWGGDFVLISGDEKDLDYFRTKGYQTIIPWDAMIK